MLENVSNPGGVFRYGAEGHQKNVFVTLGTDVVVTARR